MPGLNKRRAMLCGALMMASLPVLADDVLSVGHIRPDTGDEHRSVYFLELLEAALVASAKRYGPFELREAPVQMTQSRAMREMQRGRYVDVIWTMSDRSREAALLPVRIPLLRGLLGVRVPVVATGQADDWTGVDSLEKLRERVPGQGHDWPDTRVLAANGIRVETVSAYESLFRMLARHRIDYVPRAVAEVWAEEALYQRYDLKVLSQPLIVYPAPIYFFVAPDNKTLAERLEYGLQALIQSGEFEELFESHPANRWAIDNFLDEAGTMIRLHNPDLSPETPLDNPDLWFEGVFDERDRQGAEPP
jgi:hypothetical protein